MTRISIIIRCYNEAKGIVKLFAGIALQSIKDVEVIVVDSGSTDDTVALARLYGAKIVHIDKQDFSFGRALNKGCEVANGDILVFASAHVYPLRTDWLELLTRPFSDDRVALTYGRQIGNEITKFSEHQVFKTWFPAISDYRQQHNFCNNANCAIRSTSWERHKYNEVLTGLEDLAWAKHILSQGGHISYVADAVIAHVHEESWDRIRNRYRREAIALKKIEPSIRFNIADFLWLSASNIVSDIIAARREAKLLKELSSILLFRLNQFYGTWRGHKSTAAIDADLRNRFYYPSAETPALQTLDRASTTIEYDGIMLNGVRSTNNRSFDLTEVWPSESRHK